MIYQYTRKKFAKIPKNTQHSSKYTQNYTQVYTLYLKFKESDIPNTRIYKLQYTVYPKTLADPGISMLPTYSLKTNTLTLLFYFVLKLTSFH